MPSMARDSGGGGAYFNAAPTRIKQPGRGSPQGLGIPAPAGEALSLSNARGATRSSIRNAMPTFRCLHR